MSTKKYINYSIYEGGSKNLPTIQYFSEAEEIATNPRGDNSTIYLLKEQINVLDILTHPELQDSIFIDGRDCFSLLYARDTDCDSGGNDVHTADFLITFLKSEELESIYQILLKQFLEKQKIERENTRLYCLEMNKQYGQYFPVLSPNDLSILSSCNRKNEQVRDIILRGKKQKILMNNNYYTLVELVTKPGSTRIVLVDTMDWINFNV